MGEQYVKYLPLYVTVLMHKFPYAGVDRSVNYQFYLKFLRLCYLNLHKATKPIPIPEEKPKEDE
jgi:hypothetical protein